MPTITTHCLVVNEENFIWHAIKSVVDFVDKIIIFDTGSADKTVEIIKKLVNEYPDKIVFEEKGCCDKKRHTELRQEMINRTTTDWFMILDGDEIWTDRVMREAIDMIGTNSKTECIIGPFYLCVGDIYHKYFKEIKHAYPRFVKIVNGVHWSGDYNEDTLLDKNSKEFSNNFNTIRLKNKYWHLTHLQRSSTDDDDYSSYGSRKEKRRLTYFLIGRKIKEVVPEVFLIASLKSQSLNCFKSIFNFFLLLSRKVLKI